MSMTTIYLVRHGQTEWNIEHRMQGHQDSPLTELGIKQAQWLGEALNEEHIDIIYSSTSLRAYGTAELLRNGRTIDIRQCDEFKEMNLGEWEGQTQAEVKEKAPDQFDHFWNRPTQFLVAQSEKFEEVQERAVNKLNQIVQEQEGKSILIVSHTVVVKVLMAYFEGRPLDKIWDPPYIHPTCLCKIKIDIDRFDILLHGDISHFKEDLHPYS